MAKVSVTTYLGICLWGLSCTAPLEEKGNIGCIVGIDTNLEGEDIMHFTDTLLLRGELTPVPEKWNADTAFNYSHLDYRFYYFPESPEEMYMVSFGGGACVIMIYNNNLKKEAWISDEDTLSEKERLRVKNRFRKEILTPIEKLFLKGPSAK